MRRLARLVARAAPTDWPVLVRGESGTGKELVAHAVHRKSDRSGAPFVAVNGGALSPALASSSLFGHERGAFTGASQPRQGAFRRAHRGTLFIDEVASLPAPVQASLLRVLEEGVVEPVGRDAPVVVDVRLIAATCEGLEEAVRRGRFRADLYERLATCVVRIPPLRERLDDLPLLVPHLLGHMDHALAPIGVDDETYDLLRAQHLPGNVRELRNILCQAALEADGPVLDAHAVRRALFHRGGSAVLPAPALAKAERPRIDGDLVRNCLAASGGNVTAAARLAKLPRSTFRDAIRRLAS